MSADRSGIRVLAFEGFYAASHRAFLDGLAAHSRHQWTLLTLPGSKWRQRMLRGAVKLAGKTAELDGQHDVIFATDMLDLADLAAQLPAALGELPRALYFHENQLTYPLRPGVKRDPQLCLINVSSALAAGLVVFNSEFHRRDFLGAVPGLLESLPDSGLDPVKTAARIEKRSAVAHPGIDVEGIAAPERSGPLRVLWNHRWEYDKCPEAFFAALSQLARRGADFRVIVCGEQFHTWPEAFERGRSELGGRVEHFGYAASQAEYRALLGRADVGVSTAVQESFGISVLEACAAGCMPLLPERLSYPELIPDRLRDECIYADADDLVARLAALAHDPEKARARRDEWQAVAERFAWPRQAALMDSLLEGLTG